MTTTVDVTSIPETLTSPTWAQEIEALLKSRGNSVIIRRVWQDYSTFLVPTEIHFEDATHAAVFVSEFGGKIVPTLPYTLGGEPDFS